MSTIVLLIFFTQTAFGKPKQLATTFTNKPSKNEKCIPVFTPFHFNGDGYMEYYRNFGGDPAMLANGSNAMKFMFCTKSENAPSGRRLQDEVIFRSLLKLKFKNLSGDKEREMACREMMSSTICRTSAYLFALNDSDLFKELCGKIKWYNTRNRGPVEGDIHGLLLSLSFFGDDQWDKGFVKTMMELSIHLMGTGNNGRFSLDLENVDNQADNEWADTASLKEVLYEKIVAALLDDPNFIGMISFNYGDAESLSDSPKDLKDLKAWIQKRKTPDGWVTRVGHKVRILPTVGFRIWD